MKVKIVIVVVAAAALSFATAGSAAAQPSGHRPARPPQVTGARLQGALLPPSAFSNDFTFSSSLNTGGKLQSTRAKEHVSSTSCDAFEDQVIVSDFGNTAGAAELYSNPNLAATYPGIISGEEQVLQFATTAAATTFYNQARAKYVACRDFTTSFNGTPAEVTTLSVSNTTISRHRAFVVTEGVALSGFSYSLFFNTLYVVAGAVVYSLFDFSGTNDEPSPTLMTELINRVQALYPHHR